MPISQNQNRPVHYDKLEHFNVDHADYVVVNWCVGNTCNYRCSYCPDFLHSGSVPWPDLDVTIEFCKKVISHYKGKKLYFEFTGGEVTMWNGLIPLSLFLKEHGCKVGIISNGSRSLDFWNKIMPAIDHVCLSFHPEFSKDKHFTEVVQLCSQNIRTHVNIMMSPDKFNACYALATDIKNIKNISLALQPLVIDFGSQLYDYTSSQKDILDRQHDLVTKYITHDKKFDYFRGAMAMIAKDGKRIPKSPQRFISSSENNWQGWHCYIGVEQIVIDADGNIFRGWCLVGGKIGHVTDSDLLLPSTPVLCTKTMCHCNLDIMATKERVLSSRMTASTLEAL